MQSQASSDTKPEMLLRRELFSRGYRYRVRYPVPGLSRRSIDVAFPTQKVAVMVDGCFWHGCSLHGPKPKHNADWWAAKIAGNQARDRQTNEALRLAGWTVVRIWEHQSLDEACAMVGLAVSQNRGE